MKRIRLNDEVWIVKSLWPEAPNGWQTDVFGTSDEAENMFMFAMKEALHAKIIDPSGETTHDYEVVRRVNQDGKIQQVDLKEPMQDGGTETWG